MSASNHHNDGDSHENEQCVTLVVVNTQQLEPGLSATYTFDISGGSIGASPEDDWTLRDNDDEVHQSHAFISVIDGHFCLTDTSGACYINGATVPLGLGKSVKFNEKDMIELGNYQLRVNFYSKQQRETGNWHGLDHVFESELKGIDLDGHDANDVESYVPLCGQLDPLAALSDATPSSINDPRLDNNNLDKASLDLYAAPRVAAGVTVQADSEHEMGSAIVLKRHLPSEDLLMDENILERLEEEMGRNLSQSVEPQSHAFRTENNMTGSAPHLLQNGEHNLQDCEHNLPDREQNHDHNVVTPMIRGLGVPIQNVQDSAKVDAVAEEMGATLKAVIEGLLNLHQHVGESRFGIMNKNLQPIEDNPLRLGLSYQETVQTLFDDKRSAVHLCAPAAIEETLRNVKNHNDAAQTATSLALNQILHAFSPEVLLTRFLAYRRQGQAIPESQDAWAWQMYQSYYRELTSNRQNGFEKLFWEIFEQAYDKQIREKQCDP